MSGNKDTYENPLVSRNASPEMCRLFSPRHRIMTWRRIWLTVAEAQAELGLPVSKRQIAELRRTIEDIDWDRAAEHEKKLRHDVMAHLHAWGDVAPKARGILHLGMTSMDVVDNADLIIMREAMVLIRDWLVNAIDALGTFARQWRNLPCLGFTHYQPAQLTTVGRRACLWAYEFVRDFEEMETAWPGCGSAAFAGRPARRPVSCRCSTATPPRCSGSKSWSPASSAFKDVEPVTGQTYTRKIDAQVAATLAGVAASAHKFANDIRLLAGMKEIEEPFEKSQVGSSAMAYKRNPMRCERMTGLARYVISIMSSPFQTAAEQWFERTLDDSSNKRLTTPEGFLATDGILQAGDRRVAGAGCLPQGDRSPRAGRVAVHGHGGDPDGRHRRRGERQGQETLAPATGRHCTRLSANTRRPPRWRSRCTAGRTICCNGCRATRPSPTSTSARPSTPGDSSGLPRNRSIISSGQWSDRSSGAMLLCVTSRSP